ncbi:F-box family protein [Striga asiatica]|uniref:F-box family protein n=1 Tax=Striga asiatica TaxID=4170 RepID=A0A5A7PAP0_STRAF|nr:F-box family protein [Striga asiatica]
MRGDVAILEEKISSLYSYNDGISGIVSSPIQDSVSTAIPIPIPIRPPDYSCSLRKLKFVKDPSGIKILHSCNGLLLCSSFKTSHHNRKYYVYNPTTNKFVLLPKPELGGEICGMSLAFDPINSPHYKVISITDHNQCQLKIYSSETGSWRNHGQPPQVGVDFENGVYWNGAIHWTSNENRNDSLYFNVDNQLFGTMPIPPAGWRCVNNYYFGESCGHLHYIKVMEPSLQFKVYEMRRDYSGWFVKYEVNLLPLLKAYPSIKRHGVGPTSSSRFAFSILCLVRGEKEEGSFLVVQIPGKAVRYNLVCGTFDVLYEFAGVNSPGKVPRTNESDSAQTVFSIDDLLIAIFLCLPIKDLVQLRRVSKQWHRLISNPRFSIQRNPIPNPAAGIFLQCVHYVARLRIEYVPFTGLESTKPQLRKLKFVKDPYGIKILHSCNGLLLCSSFRARDSNLKYYVHNPTTNKFILLPKLDSVGICGMSLAFDLINSPHYKVICVRRESGCKQCQLEVYSSETGSWRNHGQTPQVGVDFENGVYWNGAIHWTSNGTGNDSLYFNVDNQLFGTMPIPPAGWDCADDDDDDFGESCEDDYYLGESCGHLHYIKGIGRILQFKVYEMRRDYSEWFVKYEVNLLPLLKAYPSVCPISSSRYAFSILCLVRGEKEEGSFLVVQIPGKAVRYNLVCGTFDMLYEFAGVNSAGRLRYSGADAFQYVETLCCV